MASYWRFLLVANILVLPLLPAFAQNPCAGKQIKNCPQYEKVTGGVLKQNATVEVVVGDVNIQQTWDHFPTGTWNSTAVQQAENAALQAMSANSTNNGSGDTFHANTFVSANNTNNPAVTIK